MATNIKDTTIATTYKFLLKRDSGTYSQPGMNIELQNDSGTALATGLYLESGAVTDFVGIATPQTALHVNDTTTAVLTIARTSAIVNNDIIGSLAFGAIDPHVTALSTAKISAIAAQDFTASTSGDAGTDLAFYTTPIGATASTVKMTILDSGNVGLGITAPVSTLDVVSTLNDEYAGKFYNSDSSDSYGVYISAGIDADDKAFYVQNRAQNKDILSCVGNGNVGIGIAPAAHQLHVYAEDTGDYAARFHNAGNAIAFYGIRIDCGQNVLGSDGDAVWALLGDGDGGAVSKIQFDTDNPYAQFVASSDKRLKSNIEDTDVKGLDILNSIKWRQFDWNDSEIAKTDYSKGAYTGHVDMWLIADEVEEVLPNNVSVDENGYKQLGNSF